MLLLDLEREASAANDSHKLITLSLDQFADPVAESFRVICYKLSILEPRLCLTKLEI
jgi:hypothetical protein